MLAKYTQNGSEAGGRRETIFVIDYVTNYTLTFHLMHIGQCRMNAVYGPLLNKLKVPSASNWAADHILSDRTRRTMKQLVST